MKSDCSPESKKKSSAEILLSWFPTITPQGDGSVIVRPGKPVAEMTVTQAAKFMGCDPSSIRRLLYKGYLTARRPLRKKTLIPAVELEEWREKTKDPEFWDGCN